MGSELDSICCWEIINHSNGPFTLFPSADASYRKLVTRAMFASKDQLILNGAGLWINAGRCEIFLVQLNSPIHNIMRRLRFIKTHEQIGEDSFACNECRHSWSVRLANRGASISELVGRYTDCNKCKCSSLFTSPFEFTGECPVCIIDEELIKFTNCIHGVCSRILQRLDKCPVCRTDFNNEHVAAITIHNKSTTPKPATIGSLPEHKILSYIESANDKYQTLIDQVKR